MVFQKPEQVGRLERAPEPSAAALTFSGLAHCSIADIKQVGAKGNGALPSDFPRGAELLAANTGDVRNGDYRGSRVHVFVPSGQDVLVGGDCGDVQVKPGGKDGTGAVVSVSPGENCIVRQHPHEN